MYCVPLLLSTLSSSLSSLFLLYYRDSMQGFHEPQSADRTVPDASMVPVLLPAMARLGVPVLVFGACFLILVWAVTFLTSPDRFPVHTGDAIVRLQDLESRVQLLKSQKATLEKTRQQLQTTEKAPVLTQVASLSQATVPLGDVLLSIEEARSSLSHAPNALITLPRMEYADGTLTLGGDVRDASGRSMQILAEFVDSLRMVLAVVSVSEPEYVTRPRAEGGSISPFILILTLRRA